MKSVHQLKRLAGLFGDVSSEVINTKIQKMVKLSDKDKYRYSNSYDKAPLILDYVNANEIGKLP